MWGSSSVLGPTWNTAMPSTDCRANFVPPGSFSYGARALGDDPSTSSISKVGNGEPEPVGCDCMRINSSARTGATMTDTSAFSSACSIATQFESTRCVPRQSRNEAEIEDSESDADSSQEHEADTEDHDTRSHAGSQPAMSLECREDYLLMRSFSDSELLVHMKRH